MIVGCGSCHGVGGDASRMNKRTIVRSRGTREGTLAPYYRPYFIVLQPHHHIMEMFILFLKTPFNGNPIPIGKKHDTNALFVGFLACGLHAPSFFGREPCSLSRGLHLIFQIWPSLPLPSQLKIQAAAHAASERFFFLSCR